MMIMNVRLSREVRLLILFSMAIVTTLITVGCAMTGIAIGRIVTPEQFGAVGDGLKDDTEALKIAFSTKKTVILKNTYRVTASLSLESSLSGNGTIFFDRDGISMNITGGNISIKGIHFDYRNHYGRMLKLHKTVNADIDGCVFTNVGNVHQEFANGMLVLTGECENVTITNCYFTHCMSSPNSSSQGIWIQQNNPETLNHRIFIRNCYFEDFQTMADADAIKVLGGNYDCFLYVENCEFRKCAKRAMKFQGRECHSSNNKIYVTEPMHCAISFQRGYGTSSKDTIIIDYNGHSPINKDAGLLYRAVTISQGNVKLDGLNILAENIVKNAHQAVVGLVSYGDSDSIISNVTIINGYFNNGGVFLRMSENVEDIEGLTIQNSEYVEQFERPLFDFSRTSLRNAYIDIDVLASHNSKNETVISESVESSNTINIRKR